MNNQRRPLPEDVSFLRKEVLQAVESVIFNLALTRVTSFPLGRRLEVERTEGSHINEDLSNTKEMSV